MSKFKFLALAILALFSCVSSLRASSIGDEYNVEKSFGDDALIPLEDTVVEEKDDFEDDPDDYVKALDESDITDDEEEEEEETEADVMAYRVDYWPTPSYRPPYWPKFLGLHRRLRPSNERLGFGEFWFPTTYPIGEGIYRSKRSIEHKHEEEEEEELARSEKESAGEIRDGRSVRTKGKTFSQSLSDQIRSKASSQKRQGKSFRKWIAKKADKLRKKLDKKLAKKGLLRTRRAATDTDRQPRSLKRWFEKKKEKLRAKWAKKWAKKSSSSYYQRFPNFPHYNYRTTRDAEQGDEPENESTKVEEAGGDEERKELKKRRIFRQQPYYGGSNGYPSYPYSPNNPYGYPYNPYNPYPGPYNPIPNNPNNAYPSVFDILAGLAGDVVDWDSDEWEDEEEYWEEKNKKAASAVAARSAHRGLLTSLIHGVSHALDRPTYYYNRPSRYNYYRPGGYYHHRPYGGSGFGDWRSKQAQLW